jgi:hypothetical protein
MVKLIIGLGFFLVVGLTFWKFKILKRKYLEPVFIGIMILGIVSLCQPLVFALYSYGLAITMIGIGGYMFVSHMKV